MTTTAPIRKAARVRSFITRYAEDIALASGVTCTGTGVGMAFGSAYALIFVGAALIAYGVWITRRT